MNALVIAALAVIAVIVVMAVVVLRWSARLSVVAWPGGHPCHAPRVSPAEVARLRAGLASRAHGGAR